MATFKAFNEGRQELWAVFRGGDSSVTTSYFALSVRDCDTHADADTMAGGFGEVHNVTTSTGYLRTNQSTPAATSANPAAVSFAAASWTTSGNTDWPSFVKSVVLCTTPSYSTSGGITAKIICAWNLSSVRNMAQASVTESVTPTLNITYS